MDPAAAVNSRGRRLMQMALNIEPPNTSNTSYITESYDSEPWGDLSDVDDPTYKPEKQKRTCQWVFDDSNINTKYRRNSQEDEDICQSIESRSSTTIISSSSIAEEEENLLDPEYREITFEDFANDELLQPQSKTPIMVDHTKSYQNTSTPIHNENNSIFSNNDEIKDTFDFPNEDSSGIIPFVRRITTSRMLPSSDEETSNNHDFHNNSSINVNEQNKLHKDILTENSRASCSNIKKITNTGNNLVTSYIDNKLNKQKKKRTVCKFCRISVTNFERHLIRQHVDEKEVQDFMKFPKNTKDGRNMRRNILALLRYEMDFENFIHEDTPTAERLPCSHCKRIIAKKYLRRHYKKCIIKPINKTGQKVQHLAASQTLVACASGHANTTATLRVKNEVFVRMAVDEIGCLARKDPLIRHFGEYYLKKHKRTQISIACSNKMRECARLLLEMRRRSGNPTLSFFQLLTPERFDDIVLAAKAISGYSDEMKNYKAPSLALHLGTTLQQICELTTHLILKNSPEFKCDNLDNRLKEIKRCRFLVQTQWSNEVSSLALKDLAEKKWNKPVMLPLTNDILKFRDYVVSIANKSVAVLENDSSNEKAFKCLVDASLSFTILFNRRRIGDVQYVEIESYLRNFTANNQTEILDQLTESEKTLTSSYKRVVAGGKGSRAIVILFPPMVQKYINLLLEIRTKTNIVPLENRYLFAYPGVTNNWIRGDVVIKKLAKSSKINNPEVMTSNRLRKQNATLMQVMNLDKNDYSQFAKFMGHTEKTHQQFYEITQDSYQTAKVAKLLNLFDQGQGTEYKNKELSSIDIDPNQILAGSDSESDGEIGEKTFEKEKGDTSNTKKYSTRNTSDNGIVLNSKKKSNRIRWTEQQKKLVTSHFKKHIKNEKAPKKDECEELIRMHQDILDNLDWVRIKTYVYNTYTMKK